MSCPVAKSAMGKVYFYSLIRDLKFFSHLISSLCRLKSDSFEGEKNPLMSPVHGVNISFFLSSFLILH